MTTVVSTTPGLFGGASIFLAKTGARAEVGSGTGSASDTTLGRLGGAGGAFRTGASDSASVSVCALLGRLGGAGAARGLALTGASESASVSLCTSGFFGGGGGAAFFVTGGESDSTSVSVCEVVFFGGAGGARFDAEGDGIAVSIGGELSDSSSEKVSPVV